MTTLLDLIKSGPNEALIDPASATKLSYSTLLSTIDQFSQYLQSISISKGDTVHISLPNSLEFVIAFLAISSFGGVVAPLNSNYTQAEFEFNIDDLKSSLIIVPTNSYSNNTPAIKAASKFKVPVLEVSFNIGDQLLSSSLVVKYNDTKGQTRSKASPEDIALVLHTSGTTGRPKAVPLSHTNLTRTMRNVIATYDLTVNDKTYLVMPLFHVHGLMAGLLATLASGGTVIIPPKFSAGTFWKDFTRFDATWYTAVPTIHQILLKSPIPDPIPPIRFIRSCSSPLAPANFHAIEQVFKAPVLEAYAMTEAAHQMTSNPLPPKKRKPGSVGIGQGVEVRILDDDGKDTALGEICIKGENVTKGYINNPEANAKSYTKDGFFRTGDQGKLDEDGYVIITGRIKELINRGGEKISPIEVDSALLEHPAVAEAVSFAVEDEMYGQKVQAAVVLKSGKSVDEAALRKFVANILAKFKVPDRIYFTDVMPKTATGKIQRRVVSDTFAKKEAKSSKL